MTSTVQDLVRNSIRLDGSGVHHQNWRRLVIGCGAHGIRLHPGEHGTYYVYAECTEDDWRALCELLFHPEWADTTLANAGVSRKERQDQNEG